MKVAIVGAGHIGHEAVMEFLDINIKELKLILKDLQDIK